MGLPRQLREAVGHEVQAVPFSVLAKASAELTQSYKRGRPEKPILVTLAHRLAYLHVRLPATFAACRYALEKLQESQPGFAPASLLDLGAGPGTAAWAAVEAFPSIREIALVERDVAMTDIGRRLAQASPSPALQQAQWRSGSAGDLGGSHDLVIASYLFSELDTTMAAHVLRQAWQLSGQALVIVEPGTPKAFARMAEFRQSLIDAGARLAAPCPHEQRCPLFAAGDWCHFSARLERTAEHRRLKGGSLGYEDEKFSYLCATRLPVCRTEARIVRHPQKHPGHVKFELCTANGVQRETVTRSQKQEYRQARKAEWGDSWPKV